jgi:hypothetical protein
MITNTMGNIEYVNPTFTKLTGYQPEKLSAKIPGCSNQGSTGRNLIGTFGQQLLQANIGKEN